MHELRQNTMSIHARRILFLLFAIFFIVAAPTLVLYTAGYRYNFQTGKVLQTGALSVKTVPKDAKVFIDDILQEETTPTVIDTLFAGTQIIRIEKEGYTTWEKELPIHSRQTTFVEEATLFLETETKLIRESASETSIHPIDSTPAYIIRQGQWAEVWTAQISTEDPKLLIRLPLKPTQTLSIDWSSNGSYLALHTKDYSLAKIIHIQSGEVIELKEEVKGILSGHWDAHDDAVYYAKTENGLLELNVSNNQSSLVSLYAQSATKERKAHYLAEKIEDKIIISKKDEDKVTIIAYLPLGQYKLHQAPDNLLLLEDTGRERIILLDRYSSNQPILLNANAIHWKWSPRGKRLLYSDGFDLHIYDADLHSDETLTRLSTPIRAIAWNPASETFFYAIKNRIFAIELDHRDGREVIELVEADDITHLWTDQKGETLFFTGATESGEGIFERKLLE